MATLVMIADDLTGSIDASVPFSSAGVELITTPDEALSTENLSSTDNAMVTINSDSRHLSSFAAYMRVGSLVEKAASSTTRIIFKKTDSILRGNIAAELTAVWEKCGRSCLHFLPAWPSMGRITVNGIHCIDGTPVSESRLGQDPFDPVRTSSIKELLATQEGVPILHVHTGDPVPTHFSGIAFYDIESEEQMRQRSLDILRHAPAHQPLLLAGCAGLARALAQLLELNQAKSPQVAVDSSHLMVLFGSVNPVSQRQCAYATEQGAQGFYISEAQKLDANFTTSEKGAALCAAAHQSWHTNDITVVDATSYEPKSQRAANDVRALISENISKLLEAVVGTEKSGAIFVAGGDVLLSYLLRLSRPKVRLLGELFPGIVDTEVTAYGRALRILTKSGGFGSEDIICRVAEKLRTTSERERSLRRADRCHSDAGHVGATATQGT